MSALSKHGFERVRTYFGRCDGCGKSLAERATYVRRSRIDGTEKHLCYKCFQKWTQEQSR